MGREGFEVTHGGEARAERAGSVIRAIDGINRAVRDGLSIHGVKVRSFAGDGRSLELEVVTLGLPFVVAIRPGTIDDEDAAAPGLTVYPSRRIADAEHRLALADCGEETWGSAVEVDPTD